MNDVVLSRLLHALDVAVSEPDHQALCADGELIELRMRCLRSRLGTDMVDQSPYLSLLRDTRDQGLSAGMAEMAASA